MDTRNFKPAKHLATLPNGRDRRPPPKFEDWWAKIYVSHVTHPAWRHLTASAKDVVIIAIAKASNAACKGIKTAAGHPKFNFTFAEAKKLLNMTAPTFNRAMSELRDKGFIEVSDPGGLMFGKGRPAQYYLSDKWKSWTPSPCSTENINKARAARKNPKVKLPDIDLT